jgi:hypothetical protein
MEINSYDRLTPKPVTRILRLSDDDPIGLFMSNAKGMWYRW